MKIYRIFLSALAFAFVLSNTASGQGSVYTKSFFSNALNKEMNYNIYLPDAGNIWNVDSDPETSWGHYETAIIDKSLSSGFTDFEDALQYNCALQSECGVIITRNVKDFQNMF